MPAALPFLSAAFAAGIAVGARSALPAWLLVACGTAALLASVVLTLKKKPAGAGLLFFFLLLGALVQQAAIRSVHSPWTAVIGHELQLSGYVQEAAKVDGDKLDFFFQAEEARLEGGDWFPLQGTARVSAHRLDVSSLSYGQRLQVSGVPVRPAGQRNPGGFNYAAYLETAGVGAVLSVRGRDILLLPGQGGHGLLSAAGRLRERAGRVLYAYLPQREAGLAAGLLLGDRDAVSLQTAEAYRRLGIAHLLAVSGLHVGYVAAFALFVTGRVLRGRGGKVPVLAAVLLVLAYVLLTGGRPPVWRAALTMLLALGAAEAGREQDGLQALSAAALIMLFLRPLWLFSLSFQFSFLATAGILLLTPRLRLLLAWLPRFLAGPLAVILAAQLAVLPLQAVHFGHLSLLTVPVNLVCVPLVGIVMALGLAGVLAGLVALPLGAPLLSAVLPVLFILERAPHLAAVWPHSAWHIPAIPPAWWLVYLFLLGLFAAGVRLRPLGGKHLLVVLVVLNILVLSGWPAGGQEQLTVTFLDVGQGLSVHIRTPCGKNLLYDAGGRAGSDTGKTVILPYLRASGVRTLDMLILSHPHFDHYGGMQAVVNAMPVRMFVSSGEEEPSPEFASLLQALENASVPRYAVEEGYRLAAGCLQLDVLSPPAKRFRNTADDVNNNSLVLRLAYENFTVLLTGDAETEAIARLARENPHQSRAVVLQVPHHGSRGALSSAFMELSGAQAAVIPVGKNRFGHPHPETSSLLEAYTLRVYRTDLHGAVRFTSDGSAWYAESQVPTVTAIME